jgi:AcrR family transcriptional regulator
MPMALSDAGSERVAVPRARARGKRADALRNREAILAAATRLLATDPDASIDAIAREAGVARITLYGHFDSRAVLLSDVTEHAIAQTEQELARIDLDGDPREALGRLLEATLQLTHRFGALVVAASRSLPPDQLRRVHEDPAARVRALLERGRSAGAFRSDMPVAWQLNVVQAVVHGASTAVHRGEITATEAPRLVRDTVLAALDA